MFSLKGTACTNPNPCSMPKGEMVWQFIYVFQSFDMHESLRNSQSLSVFCLDCSDVLPWRCHSRFISRP